MRMHNVHCKRKRLNVRKVDLDSKCAVYCDLFFDRLLSTHTPTERIYMKPRQNLCLIVSMCVLSSSALAGLFDPPTPLNHNAERSLTNQEIFNAFHSFMPITGLPPRQP